MFLKKFKDLFFKEQIKEQFKDLFLYSCVKGKFKGLFFKEQVFKYKERFNFIM